MVPENGPRWHRTGDPYFPAAALLDGRWWVVRVNSFPDHPLWTLFVDGTRLLDLDDVPPGWHSPADRTAPTLDPDAVRVALAPVHGFVAYGSEVGVPCDNPFCCG